MRSSRPTLQRLLLNAPVLITVQRGRGARLALVNLYVREAMGGRDLIGRNLSKSFPELDQWLRKIGEVVRTGQPYVGVAEPVALDWRGQGVLETRYLTLVCQPLSTSQRTIEGSVLFAIDVTPAVLERRLSHGDGAWIEAALDAVATPVVIAEPGTRKILYENEAARQLSHGEPPGGSVFGQAVGLDTGYFCTDPAGTRLREDELPAARASRGEAVDAVHISWNTPFAVIPLVCFAELVPSTEALPAVVVLSFFDVSHVQRLERELFEAQAAREEFLSLAGHELRTPLTALQLQLQSLRRQYPDAAGFAAIERAASRMNGLVDQMLASARICRTRATIVLEEVDLCEVVDAMRTALAGDARRAGCSIERTGVARLSGRWDRARLECAVGSLLRNALRFGAGAPVTVACSDHGDLASFSVTDHGIGIDPKDQERIFEKFQRAVSPRHFGGLGLGLWAAREVVTHLGGTISVESAPGRGASFTVELPKQPRG